LGSVAIGAAQRAVHNKRQQARIQLPPPAAWIKLKINVWVNQLTYTISRVQLAFGLHQHFITYALTMKANLTRYNENVNIQLPGKCLTS
jgi:hypothetical protein